MCCKEGNPVRGRLNAWFLDRLDSYVNHVLATRKRALFSHLAGEIVEIGPGVGANFSFLRRGARVLAVEPNPYMHDRLRSRAAEHGVRLRLSRRSADDTGLPDNSVDAVMCSLVLCTVPDPVATLREIRRILRPGGCFVFIEHVAATKRSPRRWLQGLVHRPWRYVFEGCSTTRTTDEAIRNAGFRAVTIDHYLLKTPFLPINTQISGTCIA